jgi:hypothetical protein
MPPSESPMLDDSSANDKIDKRMSCLVTTEDYLKRYSGQATKML